MNDLVAVADYAARIAACWRQSLEGILEAGRLLNMAKAQLRHGRWTNLVERELPFGTRTARMLMAIASNPQLTDRNRGSLLPPHWRTLYELTKIEDAQFEAWIHDGTIHADMERGAISANIKQGRRAARERGLGERQIADPDGKFGVIIADDEWDHVVYSRETGMDRHAANHYETADDAHTALELHERTKDRFECAAPDCLLGMWATVQHLDIAIDLMRLRGFRYVSHYVWAKDKVGLGYWNRNKHDILLLGIKGDIPCPAPGTQWESLIPAPRGVHSAKPERFLEMIEQYFPTLPKIELNRRGLPRKGWAAWGNETELPSQRPKSGAAGLIGNIEMAYEAIP
jgi:N6-adenosine-specific RNA methylase IME4